MKVGTECVTMIQNLAIITCPAGKLIAVAVITPNRAARDAINYSRVGDAERYGARGRS